MEVTREELEALALHTVSSTLYYDLCDNIDTMTDADLNDLIDCKGSEPAELQLEERTLATVQ